MALLYDSRLLASVCLQQLSQMAAELHFYYYIVHTQSNSSDNRTTRHEQKLGKAVHGISHC